MGDKRFNNPQASVKWRKYAQENWQAYEDKQKKEEQQIKKYKEREKYASVVNLLSKEVLKRDNIQITYVRLYPIIKEIIETSKYLSSRYTETDIPSITSGVVEKCHYIIETKKEKTNEIER